MRRARITGLLILAAVACPAGVRAQSPTPLPAAAPAPPRHEASSADIWVAGVWSPSTSGGTITSSYAPPLVGGVGTGSASQTLSIDSSRAWGVEGGIRVFVSRHAGVEFAVSRSWASVDGRNPPYAIALDYVSRQPPDYTPRPVHYERDIDWADTEGDRRVTTIVAGPALRWLPATGRVSGTVSGGLSLQRIAGPVRSLGYTEFHLGGHSTLFYSQHRVEVEPAGDAWIVGPYLAADFRFRASHTVGLVAGVRVHLAGEPEPVATKVVRLVQPDEDVFVPDLATVESALEPGAATHLIVPRWQLFAGLTIRIM